MPQFNKTEFLKKVALFADIGPDDLDAVASLLRLRKFSKRHTLLYEGDPSDALYIIKDGSVAVTHTGGDGRETILSILKEGDVLGEMGVLDESPRSATVTLLRDTQVFILPRDEFLDLLSQRPQLNRSIITALCARLRATNRTVQTRSHLTVKARVADLLLTLASDFGEAAESGNEITIRLTHQQLANMSGTTRETMNRTLNELWDAKLIDMRRTHIVVCDTAGLAALRG